MTGEEPFDVLILGGGSAGCVLAARLSEDPARRVALVEAGPDLSDDAARASAYPGRASFRPGTVWPGLSARFGAAGRNDPGARPEAPYAQARLLGGGSALNGLGANRGAPEDYDEWAALGATDWDWAGVAPYFRRLKRDLDIADAHHGTDGPIPVRRPPQGEASRFAQAAAAALAARGAPWRADQNGAWEDGLFPIALNLDEAWTRVSAARGYLTPAVRARDNLAILAGTEARRILFEDSRAVGALVVRDGAERRLHARETVICAGALHTPALLQRSGIGPAAVLSALDAAVVAVREGVGENLLEHPAAGVAAFLPRGSRAAEGSHHIPVVVRFSSGLADAPPGDMHCAIMARAAWHPVGRRLGMLFVWVNKSVSRGRVRATPSGLDVDFRLLSDPRDRTRLAAGFRRAAAALTDAAAAGACGAPFPALPSARARRFASPSLGAVAATSLAALALDLAGSRVPGFAATLAGAPAPLATLLADADRLDAFLDAAATGVWHACGTCRMGAQGDPAAVTDPTGRVHGVEGLRVCDASLFPSIPCANLNLPVMMTAERMADLMRGRA
ncbi:MAG: GMC family oxidoreductase [Paracoccaceae bacterium]